MTVVVGLVHQGRVCLVADSHIATALTRTAWTQPKAVRVAATGDPHGFPAEEAGR